MEHARHMYTSGIEADEIPHYITIYATLATTCGEQCSIINEGVDYTVLSSVFGALPRLREISLCFDHILQGQE